MVIVQVVPSGRTEVQKRALYRALAERLRPVLREDDLIVTIVENTYVDWSFTDELARGPEGVR